MEYIFGVMFPNQGKPQYFLSNDKVSPGNLVVAESPRGIELGRVCSEAKEYQRTSASGEPFSYVLRPATEDDIRMQEQNQIQAKESIKLVQIQADNLNLGMKVTSAEYTLDRSKLMISYLADERVDFRELLKILASLYRCRIELRQIGPRDKAKMVGGIGLCGLPLCCSTFLNEFDGISITMAKNQMLALNIPKLSGHCGKLICCLKYEDQAYTLEKRDLPRVGLRVYYNDAVYRIASINIITKMVRLESPDHVETVPLSALEGRILQHFDPAVPLKDQIEKLKESLPKELPPEPKQPSEDIPAKKEEPRRSPDRTPKEPKNRPQKQNDSRKPSSPSSDQRRNFRSSRNPNGERRPQKQRNTNAPRTESSRPLTDMEKEEQMIMNRLQRPQQSPANGEKRQNNRNRYRNRKKAAPKGRKNEDN